MWLSHLAFKALVSSWWNARVDGKWENFFFLRKLRIVKGILDWNFAGFGDIKRRKNNSLR